MRYFNFSALLLALTGTLLASPSLAQRYYDVELIIFAHPDRGQANSERWRPFDLAALQDTRLSDALDIFYGQQASANRVGFTVLNSDDKRLFGARNAIARSPGFRPLLHVGWRQPGLVPGKAIPVSIKAGEQFLTEVERAVETPAAAPLDTAPAADPATTRPAANPAPRQTSPGTGQQVTAQTEPAETFTQTLPVYELEGTIKLVLGRYHHVYTDLLYHAPVSANATSPEPPATPAQTTPRLATTTTRLQGFRLAQHRRMRSGDLHYLDHPMFGMIIQVRRVEGG